VGGVVNLRANMGKRPAFTLPGEEGLEDMRPFLKDFLPRLKAANEELEAQKAAGQLQTSEIMGDEEAAGEEPYIELVSARLPSACNVGSRTHGDTSLHSRMAIDLCRTLVWAF
jgi:hypothetical protein